MFECASAMAELPQNSAALFAIAPTYADCGFVAELYGQQAEILLAAGNISLPPERLYWKQDSYSQIQLRQISFEPRLD